jgi:tripartite ATP-independent transporter DctM subunit
MGLDTLVVYLPLMMMGALVVLLFSGFPVAFVLAFVGLAFALIGHALDLFPVQALFTLPVRMYSNLADNLVYPAVPMLLLMGVALERSGIARELLECVSIVLRRLPGNLAIAVMAIGIILAPSAGLIGASVATLSLIALPTMLAKRYDIPFATGSVAAAGTLGLIFPPGLMLFFLADQLDVQLGMMFVATVIPGFVLAGLYVAYMLARAANDPTLAPAAAPTALTTRQFTVYVVRSFALPVLLITLVLGSLIAGLATPTQSGAVGAAGAILLMALNRSLSVRRFHEVLVATALMTAMVFLVIMAATIFSYVFVYLDGTQLVTDLVEGMGLGRWGTLGFVLTLIFILGFFVDWIEIAVIFLPMLSPALQRLDFSDYLGAPSLTMLWIAVLLGLNLQTSFLTPPFGFALFFLKGTAPREVRLGAIYRGVAPFVALQVLGLLLVVALPALALWLPVRLFGLP